MKQDTTIWQADAGAVFKLKESGEMKRVDGKLVPELVNDIYIRVQIQNTEGGVDLAMKEKFLAERIATMINDNPEYLGIWKRTLQTN